MPTPPRTKQMSSVAPPSIEPLLFELQSFTATQLRTKYMQVFGETTNSSNKVWLIKRIAWGIQALREGDISQRAMIRALELAKTSDIRTTVPNRGKHSGVTNPTNPVNGTNATAHDIKCDTSPSSKATLRFATDPRLPMVGSVLTRKYKKQTYQIMVQADGFLFKGQKYKSLSAIAKLITGNHCNGFSFFKIDH